MCLRHVGDISSRAHDGVHQGRRSINADVRFHPEVPVIVLLRLVHLRITLAILVLRRRWRGDQHGVSNGLLAHHQTLLGEVSVDRIEDLARQIFCFEQVTKLEQRRRVWRRLAARIDADGSANGLAVVDSLFNAFVRKTEALLGHIHPQHSRQPDWWTANAFDLRIERLDQFVQLAPRCHAIDLSALLHDPWRARNVVALSQVAAPAGTGATELISVFLVHIEAALNEFLNVRDRRRLMLFSSPIFLFMFLPLCLIAYYAAVHPIRR